MSSAASQTPPVRGDLMPAVKMEGYLEKKGKMRVVSMWKRYWFVLEGRLLLYYKSQQEYARLSPCRGSLNMGLASCVRPGPDRDDGHVLEVVLRAHVVTLRAKDRASQEQWLKALLDSMALPCVTSPSKDSKGPLHFRYPSADNLNKPDQSSGREPLRDASARKEKHRTLPNWKRTPSSTSAAMKSVPEGETPCQDRGNARTPDTPCKPDHNKVIWSRAEQRGSVLPMLKDEPTPPFGSQRYSFHCLRKVEECDQSKPRQQDLIEGARSESGSAKKGSKAEALSGGHRTTKKELHYSSVSSDSPFVTPGNVNHSASSEALCKVKRCGCKHQIKLFEEEEKENIEKQHASLTGMHFRPDENQNRLLFEDSPCEHHGRRSGSDKDLLQACGKDLGSLLLEKLSCPKPVRCTSADELRSSTEGGENMDVEYISEFQSGSHGLLVSGTPSEVHSDSRKAKSVKTSIRQRLLHGDGEYVKYSEPEECDKRDSTINTTASAASEVGKPKPKVRLRKRKGSTKDSYSYNLTDCGSGSAEKKRAPLRNRLSFLSRVLSHVRRTKSEDLMEQPYHDDHYSDDAFISPHPDMNSRCSPTAAAHLFTEVKKMDNFSLEPDVPIAVNFKLGPTDPFPGEAPEEPPPDYDSVHMESTITSADLPPQLPPRRMKRPRSPWHDVPTNNSPVIDMDGEARQRLLSAAKYGRVIGTRGSHSMDGYDWSSMNADDLAHNHGYEVVSDETSPAGSNEHLAIYLSSESSDDEFHEEVVLRRNYKECDFLYGSESTRESFGIADRCTLLEPLTIHTHHLPTLDSSGRVGLSHVEAMKLSLLMQAQKASESINSKRKGDVNKIQVSSSIGKNSYSQQDLINLDPDHLCNEEEYVQNPPAEFDDEAKELRRSSGAEIRGLISPVEKSVNAFRENNKENALRSVAFVKQTEPGYPVQKDGVGEMESQNVQDLAVKSKSIQALSSEGKQVNHNVNYQEHSSPPQLPKKFKKLWRSDSFKSSERHSDELNVLLAQLANMTTAPLLPIGATCSLQVNRCSMDEEVGGAARNGVDSTRKQSLSLGAMVNKFDLYPDYDIPRPHTSLLHKLSQHANHSSLDSPENVGAVQGLNSPSRPESPRLYAAEDQSWSGHMSPDSLDFPCIVNRSHSWDSHDGTTEDAYPCLAPSRKLRVRKDRIRRATLNGPISEQSLAFKENIQDTPLARRNSVEFIGTEAKEISLQDYRAQSERKMNGPKQIKPSSTSCEHSASALQCQRLKNCPFVADLCKTFELSTSLEDISERSELERLESASVKGNAHHSQCRNVSKNEDIDMDSLEVTEFKRLELCETESVILHSIIEEPDVNSDKSDKSEAFVDVGGSNPQSSGSTSEGALRCEGEFESKGTDQLTNHSTDTDMELSDDEVNEKLEDETISIYIEPDSLLQVSIAAGNLAPAVKIVDCTKDTSLEADSLELKKEL